MRPVEVSSAVEARPAVGPNQRDPAAGVDRPRRRRRALLVGAAVVLALLTLAFWWLAASAPAPLTPGDVDRAVQRGIEQAQRDQRSAPQDATAAYQAITPSLATVTAQRPGTGAQGTTVEAGLGSGVIINATGAVLTALHVVDGAEQIQVEFADGTTAAARIAASRPDNDIAVLAVDRLPQVVVPAVLAGPPPIGDAVFAVGNPLGLRDSLSAGVVSATGRGLAPERGPGLEGLIQFDAAVNPGNSGGPLLNRAGQVVGIVTALANPTRQGVFVGIGFAVPIATAAGGTDGPQK